jgi:outer membrane receptor protein involved in Fe transport
LSSQAVQVTAVDVTAERPLIEKNATGSVTTITAEDIRNLPTRNVESVVALSASVNNDPNYGITIRGSRNDEIAYYVEGMRATDIINGGRNISVVNNALEEVQILSGGYGAEYGQANAGIVNLSMRTGTSNYNANLEMRTNAWAKPSKEVLNTYAYGQSEYTLTLGGPVIPGNNIAKFFLAGQYESNTNNPNWYPALDVKGVYDNTKTSKSIPWAQGLAPTDTVDLEWPARVQGQNWFRFATRFNGNVLMDLKPFQVKLSGNYGYNNNNNGYGVTGIFNPERIGKNKVYNISGNLKLTHFLSSNTFYNINFNYYNVFNKTYDPIFGDDILAYCDSIAAQQYGYKLRTSSANFTSPLAFYPFGWSNWGWAAYGAIPTGYNKSRQIEIGGSFDLTHQIGIIHEIKAGGEFSRYTLRNYGVGADIMNQMINNPDQTYDLIYQNDRANFYGYDPVGNPIDEGVYRARHPIFAAAYVRDKIEFSDIVLNLGLRYDYIKSDGWALVDPSNIKFDANGVIRSDQIIDMKASQFVSPRIGFSFPLTDRTVFYSQFGKFVQQSKLRDILIGLSVASNNITGGYAVGNPLGFNIQPEKLTQYEMGFRQQLTDNLAFDLSAYYKDIKDQIQSSIEYRAATASHTSYYMYQNGDFSTTKGIEFKMTLRRTERISAQFNYTFSDARGTGSATANSIRYYLIWQSPGGDLSNLFPSYVQPLDFMTSHRGTLYLDYRFGNNDGGPILENFGLNFLFTFSSGHPFTLIGTEGNYGNTHIPQEPINNSTTPWTYNLDFRIDKTVLFGGLSVNFYVQFYNLLNTRNVANVFRNTGSADDNGYLSTAEGSAAAKASGNPALWSSLYKFFNISLAGNWYAPRVVWLGFRLDY